MAKAQTHVGQNGHHARLNTQSSSSSPQTTAASARFPPFPGSTRSATSLASPRACCRASRQCWCWPGRPGCGGRGRCAAGAHSGRRCSFCVQLVGDRKMSGSKDIHADATAKLLDHKLRDTPASTTGWRRRQARVVNCISSPGPDIVQGVSVPSFGAHK